MRLKPRSLKRACHAVILRVTRAFATRPVACSPVVTGVIAFRSRLSRPVVEEEVASSPRAAMLSVKEAPAARRWCAQRRGFARVAPVERADLRR